ncbi:MAG: putative choloylglycine hydrolase [Sulfitobacter sp.]
MLDRKRKYLTAFMAPDRETLITNAAVATNHQETVEWISHARFTATVERERYLLQRLRFHRDPEEKFIGAFLKPPLYSHAFSAGFGTLYTAVYRPRKRQMELRWPGTIWSQAIDNFEEGARNVLLPGAA